MLSKILRDSVVYGLSNGIGRLSAFITAPILTRIFVPADYGVIDAVMVSTGLFVLLIGLNLDSGMVRYYYDSDERRAQHDIANTSFWGGLALGVGLTAVALPFAASFSQALFKTTEHAHLVRLALLSIPFTLLSHHFQTVLQIQKRPRAFLAMTSVTVGLSLALTLTLVVGLRWGLTGMMTTVLISAVGTAVGYFALLRPVYRLGYSRTNLKRLLHYCLPAMPGVGLNWIMRYSNRFFMLQFTATTGLGLYAIGDRVAQLLLLAMMAFQTAWRPYAMSMIRDEGARGFYARAFSLYVVLFALAAGAISLFAREALMLFAPQAYLGAQAVIGILCLSLLVQSAANQLGMGINIAAKTHLVSIAIAIGAAVTTALNFTLIPQVGIAGAAAALLAGQLASCAFMYWQAQRLYPVRYDVGRALLALGLVASLAAAGYYLGGALAYPQALLVKLAVLVGFAAVVYSLVMTGEQRHRLRSRLGQVRAHLRATMSPRSVP
ncbi:MAG: polysaccharide biosynthesis C-terminal domain-containing protein [Chloroflexi bacterium]|nr:polysaccharide biosynthesis C-terminal domain-containing protein [Chloroflexota bacterium]